MDIVGYHFGAVSDLVTKFHLGNLVTLDFCDPKLLDHRELLFNRIVTVFDRKMWH